jgi:hypothetical protein
VIAPTRALLYWEFEITTKHFLVLQRRGGSSDGSSLTMPAAAPLQNQTE